MAANFIKRDGIFWNLKILRMKNYGDLKLFENQNLENYLQNGVWENYLQNQGMRKWEGDTWPKGGHA